MTSDQVIMEDVPLSQLVEDAYKLLNSSIGHVLKLKDELQNDESIKDLEDSFQERQIRKKEIYKKTLNLTDEHYENISNHIFDTNKRKILRIASDLQNIVDISACWNCKDSMCFHCTKKLENITADLHAIISKNNSLLV